MGCAGMQQGFHGDGLGARLERKVLLLILGCLASLLALRASSAALGLLRLQVCKLLLEVAPLAQQLEHDGGDLAAALEQHSRRGHGSSGCNGLLCQGMVHGTSFASLLLGAILDILFLFLLLQALLLGFQHGLPSCPLPLHVDLLCSLEGDVPILHDGAPLVEAVRQHTSNEVRVVLGRPPGGHVHDTLGEATLLRPAGGEHLLAGMQGCQQH
mmetsp:Transcript_16235/g.44425  ORF Transcript_16235/g.44425 Transcript_16235/m.44425 type:complete len:213 (-) Transcript_16235:797-1435(-)